MRSEEGLLARHRWIKMKSWESGGKTYRFVKLECFQARCLWPLAEWTRCSSGPEGTAAPCTTSFRSPSVYYYLSPSSPLPPALAALLPPAAPISQPRAWRSGWTPWRMPASPWLVFGASSYFFLSCYDKRRLESRISPPWRSTIVGRRSAHTTSIS